MIRYTSTYGFSFIGYNSSTSYPESHIYLFYIFYCIFSVSIGFQPQPEIVKNQIQIKLIDPNTGKLVIQPTIPQSQTNGKNVLIFI